MEQIVIKVSKQFNHGRCVRSFDMNSRPDGESYVEHGRGKKKTAIIAM